MYLAHFKMSKKTSFTLEGEGCYCRCRWYNLSLVSSVPGLRGAVAGAGQVGNYQMKFFL